jgi:type II secretory pathway pseudopilin PulG
MSLSRLRGEGGYSVFELLTVMVILGVVLTALTTLFARATNGELDQTRRFQAQQEARVAVDKMKREIHCSSSAVPPTSSTLLVLNDPCLGATISWCTAQRSGTLFYALYRSSAPTCGTTDVRWAKYLTNGNIFAFTQQSNLSLAKVGLTLTTNVKPSSPPNNYTLTDSIVLRNSQRICLTGSTTVLASPSPPC